MEGARSLRKDLPYGKASNESVQKCLGISLPFSHYILTEWGLNLTDGMKQTIIAPICNIIAAGKRDRMRQTKQGAALENHNVTKEEIGQETWSQSW